MFMKTAPTCQFLSCRLDCSWLRLPGVRLGFLSVTPDPAAAPSRKRITFLFRDSAATAFVTSILALFHSEIKTILDFFIIYSQSPFRNFNAILKYRANPCMERGFVLYYAQRNLPAADVPSQYTGRLRRKPGQPGCGFGEFSAHPSKLNCTARQRSCIIKAV